MVAASEKKVIDVQIHSVGIDPGKTTFPSSGTRRADFPARSPDTLAITLAKMSIEMPETLENAAKCI